MVRENFGGGTWKSGFGKVDGPGALLFPSAGKHVKVSATAGGPGRLRRTGIAAVVALSSGAVLLRQPVGHALSRS